MLLARRNAGLWFAMTTSVAASKSLGIRADPIAESAYAGHHIYSGFQRYEIFTGFHVLTAYPSVRHLQLGFSRAAGGAFENCDQAQRRQGHESIDETEYRSQPIQHPDLEQAEITPMQYFSV